MNHSQSNGMKMLKLAKYVMWGGIGAAFIIGVLVLLKSELVHGLYVESSVENALKGALIIVCGSALAWFLGFLLKTVGQMAKDTEDMRNGVPVRSSKYKGEKPLLQRMSKYWGFYLMFVPVLVFVAVFHYAPMFGIQYAFYSWKIIGDPTWVGLANFEKLFSQNQMMNFIR